MAEATGVYVPPTIEHADWDRTEEKIKLFAITRPDPEGGEPSEVWYTIPGKPHVGLGLAFLRNARLWGVELAMSWLLEEAVGTEGYLALAAEPDLDPDDMKAIMVKCRKVVLGGLDGPKG